MSWEEIGDRVFEHSKEEFKYVCRDVARVLDKLCESPIEHALGTSIWICGFLQERFLHGSEYTVTDQAQEAHYPSKSFLLIPQFKWENYRFDFAIASDEMRNRYVFIECDGHEFHERTKAQAARDRQKDRFTQISGIPILRYTGSEIYRRPYGCASEIVEFIQNRSVEDFVPRDPK